MHRILITTVTILMLVSGSIYYFTRDNKLSEQITESAQPPTSGTKAEFSNFNSKFRFSAIIPEGWILTYIPQIESIALSNTSKEAQIFIRYFEANQFLTLKTVDILRREETKIGIRDAIIYEIQKKPGVPDFPYQPDWRNRLHSLIDIRLSQNSPSLFYVFARNPQLPQHEFEKFINSIAFYDDL
jgi:hypothetical protein